MSDFIYRMRLNIRTWLYRQRCSVEETVKFAIMELNVMLPACWLPRRIVAWAARPMPYQLSKSAIDRLRAMTQHRER